MQSTHLLVPTPPSPDRGQHARSLFLQDGVTQPVHMILEPSRNICGFAPRLLLLVPPSCLLRPVSPTPVHVQHLQWPVHGRGSTSPQTRLATGPVASWTGVWRSLHVRFCSRLRGPLANRLLGGCSPCMLAGGRGRQGMNSLENISPDGAAVGKRSRSKPHPAGLASRPGSRGQALPGPSPWAPGLAASASVLFLAPGTGAFRCPRQGGLRGREQMFPSVPSVGLRDPAPQVAGRGPLRLQPVWP